MKNICIYEELICKEKNGQVTKRISSAFYIFFQGLIILVD